MPDQKIFFWIAASAADATVVNPNSIKALLVGGLIVYWLHFPLKENQYLEMVLKVYLKILLIFLFYAIEMLIIFYKLIYYSKKLYMQKLVSTLEVLITYDERLKFNSATLFIAFLKLLSCD